uniref:Uncharacterized protein n=1 Tax=Anguilla anguilla TaxID=7936 RepID=A0A0E9VA88_ANGAN
MQLHHWSTGSRALGPAIY